MKPKGASQPLVHNQPPCLALREAPRSEVCLSRCPLVTCLFESVHTQPVSFALPRPTRPEEESGRSGGPWASCACLPRKVAR